MNRKSFFLSLILIGVSLFVVGLALEGQSYEMGCYPTPGDHYYTHAPDGTYEALITQVRNDSTVFIPLCPSYGGQLHGTWKYNNYSVVFERNTWYCVTLKNDIIIQAEEMYA